MTKSSGFSLQFSEDNIAIISIDVPGEKQNVLKASFIKEFNVLLDEIEASTCQGVILISGKEDCFIAGADINMLKAMDSRAAIAEVANAGYAIFNRIETFAVPVVVAVHGICLGGGLELSLACHGRVASNSELTRFALPEVQIGLLPGGGGTQRLPELVGILEALNMMTTGRQINVRKARRMGLVDKVVDAKYLLRAATDLILEIKASGAHKQLAKPRGWFDFNGQANYILNRYLLRIDWLVQFITDKAREKVLAKTKGKYPAPLAIVDCVAAWARGNKQAGFEVEAEKFADLILSPEANQLMNLFFAISDLKKARFIKGRTQPKRIERLGVVGGGLMGSGIALVSAQKARVAVRVKEISQEGLKHCFAYSWNYLSKGIKRRRIKASEAKIIQGRITGDVDYSGFKPVDLAIEAAFESLEVKHQVMKELDAVLKPDAIIATNTSSIPISEIAKACKKPERLVGMHYFSPVEKMPLLEVIKTEQTSDKAIITAVNFGRAQGKTVIVVSDGAGFYTSRILAAYINEAAHLLSEGVAVDTIDRAMVDFGFPVGPFTLLDEVGIDVATKILPVLQQAFGERMTAPDCFGTLIESGRLGKKANKGFYDYSDQSKKQRQVDQSLYQDLNIAPHKTLTKEEIQQRCHMIFLNEANRCLEEGIIACPRDGDIGAIFGLGYPPFLGGPFRYMDSVGLETIMEQTSRFEVIDKSRFSPSQSIIERYKNHTCYY